MNKPGVAAKKIWGTTAMLAATVLWGVAFSAQSRGMEHMGPVLFTALRSAAGTAVLCAVILCLDICRYKKVSLWGGASAAAAKKHLIAGGIWCGIAIAAASVLQQAGLKYSTAGKTGFLTSLYIIIVPLAGLIFFKRKTSLMLWAAVVLALCGTYLLCGGAASTGRGELLVIACAAVYSVHVLVIDKYAPLCDCVRLSCIQFAVAAVLTTAGSLIAGEEWSLTGISNALPFWLFCGIGSSAIAFTLQIFAQKYLHPVTAALLMSLESVFAVIGGWLFLQERLSAAELCGCAAILVAVIITQIPGSVFCRRKKFADKCTLLQ